MREFIFDYAVLMLRIILITTLTVVLALNFAQAAVYKKVNPDGSVEYSDTPENNSAEVELRPMQTVPAIKLPAAAKTKPEQQTESIENFRYKSLQIISPKDDEPVRNNAGILTAKAKIEPALRSQYQHHIEWLLDGNKIESASGLSITVNDVARGSHQLQVRVIDYDGNVVIAASPITFHMLRVVIQPAK